MKARITFVFQEGESDIYQEATRDLDVIEMGDLSWPDYQSLLEQSAARQFEEDHPNYRNIEVSNSFLL